MNGGAKRPSRHGLANGGVSRQINLGQVRDEEVPDAEGYLVAGLQANTQRQTQIKDRKFGSLDDMLYSPNYALVLI